MSGRVAKATRPAAAEHSAVVFYNPSANGYDLAKDPRCLWGWGPPACGCRFGHACFRRHRHDGLCWDGGEPPSSDDRDCHTSQRPAEWDDHGRAEANR